MARINPENKKINIPNNSFQKQAAVKNTSKSPAQVAQTSKNAGAKTSKPTSGKTRAPYVIPVGIPRTGRVLGGGGQKTQSTGSSGNPTGAADDLARAQKEAEAFQIRLSIMKLRHDMIMAALRLIGQAFA